MSVPPGRVGMFGGAFDPPHRAHVALARAAVEQCGLDELRVFPTGAAWHKSPVLAGAEHRLAMARIAFGGLPHMVVDDRELRRAGATYTIDTLRELQAAQPQAELFLVMGQDQAAAFTTWRDWQAIARMATICVAQRPGSAQGALPAEARVLALSLPPMDDSATDVRSRLAARQDVSRLVPPGVAGYIAQHCLYQPN